MHDVQYGQSIWNIENNFLIIGTEHDREVWKTQTLLNQNLFKFHEMLFFPPTVNNKEVVVFSCVATIITKEMETGGKKLPLISATETSLQGLLKQRTQWHWCTHVFPFTRCFSCCSHETLNQDFRWETQSSALHYPFIRCIKKNLEGPFVGVFPLRKKQSRMSLKSIPLCLKKIIDKTFWNVVLHPSPSGYSYCSFIF